MVALAGPQATELAARHFEAASGRPLSDAPWGRIVYGRWGGEDLVVCRLSDEELEIHCHGGTQSSARILEALVEGGAVQVDWQEWLRSHCQSELQAEAQLTLAAAATQRTAVVLLDQYHGALEREIEAIGELSASNLSIACVRLERLLERAKFGMHLTRPWRVAIAGRPNVGKSTLINRLAGYERAIVFDEPGTTRDAVTVTTALDGWPVELVDTAGLQATGDEIEQAGIALARDEIRRADLVLWLLDATAVSGDAAEEQAAECDVALEPQRLMVVLNKWDLAPLASAAGAVMAISAATGMGVEALQARIVEALAPVVPAAGEAVPFTDRQVQLLREALARCEAGDAGAARRALGGM